MQRVNLLQTPFIFPTYNPPNTFVQFIKRLKVHTLNPIIIVNDGSHLTYLPTFQAIKDLLDIHIIEHPRNLGKGKALKSGFMYALKQWPNSIGVVCADADSQHHQHDILNLSLQLSKIPHGVHLGVRCFDSHVPLRSRLGNLFTRAIFKKWVAPISDTQTGLRALPMNLLPKLTQLPANGYQFEMQCLLKMVEDRWCIYEHPIQTIYRDNSKISHFKPFFDSCAIYSVMIKALIRHKKLLK